MTVSECYQYIDLEIPVLLVDENDGTIIYEFKNGYIEDTEWDGTFCAGYDNYEVSKITIINGKLALEINIGI